MLSMLLMVSLHRIYRFMMINRKILLLLFIFSISSDLVSQNSQTPGNYATPLDTPMVLSGTYGEIRNNHFHSGIDFKTGGVEGKNVYAIDNGYISRINISSSGYGKALYIIHPDGKMSVYCHLASLNPKINSYLRREQYKLESFEVDLYVIPDSLPVRKGEVIALSGNSGGSAGPHLHFEIRDSGYNQTYNPLARFKIKDDTPPYINLLKIYPADKNTLINGKNTALTFSVSGKGKNHKLLAESTPVISGNAYFGLQSYDPFNLGKNINGIYSVKLLIDTTTVFLYDFEAFRFDQTRYINSLIEYKVHNKHKIQRSFVEPNNRLDIYKIALNNGVYLFNEDRNYLVTYQVKDYHNNVAELRFNVKGKKDSNPEQKDFKNNVTGTTFSYLKDNTFRNENIIFDVPGIALYNNLDFKYATSPRTSGFYSDFHILHDESVPLHTHCKLSVKPVNVPERFKDKCLLVQVTNSGEIKSAGGAMDEDGYVSTNIRNLGKYAVKIDTVIPGIKPINIFNNKKLSTQKDIRFKIWDNLSGIKSYSGRINGNWVLMEYDAKTGLLIYYFDSNLKKGSNQFELKVVDRKNNFSVFKAKFTY